MAEPLPLPVFHVVGFTGHRQLRDTAGVARKIGEVLADLRARGGADWIALSSVAEGADLVFARTARKLGLGWEALLPLPPAEFRTDFSSETWRYVEQLLTQAEHGVEARRLGEREAHHLAAARELASLAREGLLQLRAQRLAQARHCAGTGEGERRRVQM